VEVLELPEASNVPDPSIRRERELARYRLHLVRHRTTLKNRIHAKLMTFGHPCPASDLFGHAGRELLDRLAIPDPWRRTVDASLELIDDLEWLLAAHPYRRRTAPPIPPAIAPTVRRTPVRSGAVSTSRDAGEATRAARRTC
jgi:transposase